MNDLALAPLRTAHEWVREHLRQDILNGVYRPGDSLKQTDLAARLGVSVTPVREAMRDLATEGLVVIDPQRVARVRDLDPNEAYEVNEIRRLLEPLAARFAARNADDDAIGRIRELAEAGIAAETDAEWLDANRRFHLAVISAAGAPLLAGILANLRQISSVYLATAVRTTGVAREKSKREHLALADAIAERDGETAVSIMESHLVASELIATLVADHNG